MFYQSVTIQRYFQTNRQTNEATKHIQQTTGRCITRLQNCQQLQTNLLIEQTRNQINILHCDIKYSYNGYVDCQ